MEDLEKSWTTVGSAGTLNQADLAKVTLHQSIVQLGTELASPPAAATVTGAPHADLVTLPTTQAVVRYNVSSADGLFNTGVDSFRHRDRSPRGNIDHPD
jgi:hypothetical protein